MRFLVGLFVAFAVVGCIAEWLRFKHDMERLDESPWRPRHP